MTTTAETPAGSPAPSLEQAESGLAQTSSLRLSPGAIPSAWTQPAEVVSRLPAPAPRPLLSGLVVGAGVLACVAVAYVLAPRPAPPPPAPAPSTAPVVHDEPKPIEEIPAPPPPKHAALAPEDESAPPAAPSAPAVAHPAAVTSSDVVGAELPARKKAHALTQRAIALLRDGDSSGAEPLLVRAVLVDPAYAEAWRHLGIARAQLGDRDGARRAYRKYVTLDPHAPDAAEVRKILAAP